MRGLGPRGRIRAFGLLLVVGIAFAAIVARLTIIQGVDSKRYLEVGQSEWTHSVTLAGERGAILDRNGDELAMSVPQTTIYADPHEIDLAQVDPDAVKLSAVLGVPVATLESDLSENEGFVYLARTVPEATAKKVAALDLTGIASLKEPKRFYPAGQLASPLLGTVGTDGYGLGGLESKYNSVLEGKAGKLVEETDPEGHELPGGLQEYKAPVAGDDLVLSIDEPLQYDAEQALAQAIVAAGAKSGIAILMDRKTGEILADAQLTMPGADTTTTPAVPVDIPSPGATTDGATTASKQVQPVEEPSASSFTQVYEPGSVNKLITISAALQEGVIKPSDTFSIPNTYDVAGTTFHDSEAHPTEHWTVTDILANSSNIGTIQIAQRLGKTDLLKYIHDYGEGSASDIDFPGESAGLLPSYWSGTSIADVPIGQGIGVTAIQLISAYNTIANGGVYVAPKLVDGVIDAQGKEHPTPPSATHRVVSSTVAAEMTTMLDEVVRVGTGTGANLSPYTVAGKTGTALVPDKGGYEAGHYVASFAGFVPSEKPAITAMVVINNTLDYGAAASAPTFATIARDALQELKIPPQKSKPPAAGVPLATPETATGAGEVAGTPLPGLSTPVSVAPSTSTTVPTAATPAATTPATTTPAATSPTTASPGATTPTTTAAAGSSPEAVGASRTGSHSKVHRA
jgi:cell division protein FtsI (penicillin-binding protein 3)